MKKIFPLYLFLSLLFCFPFSPSLHAAKVGMKYNRPPWEYPEKALQDFQRFSDDRIQTVMISLSWHYWQPKEGSLDQDFLKNGLDPVLKFAEEHGIQIIIANHSSYWGHTGDWSMPDWLRAKRWYGDAADALTGKLARAYQISFLEKLIDATHGYQSVVGYSILNEPVTVTPYFLKRGRRQFDLRWQGSIEIIKQIRQHMKSRGVSQFLMIGIGNSDEADARYIWTHTDKVNLMPIWTELLDRIGAQETPVLMSASKWYRNLPKIRTEGALSFLIYDEIKKTRNYQEIKTYWDEKNGDNTPVYYDYDEAYNYEGYANAAIPELEAFYPWRIGATDGSDKHLLFFDHRNEDRPTPYYFALRDLASGIDSFETLARNDLPQNGEKTLVFDPTQAKPGISPRWNGSGKIIGSRRELPPGTLSTISAEVTLESGESVYRSVITDHWLDTGVSLSDSLVFWAKSDQNTELQLEIALPGKRLKASANLVAGSWNLYRVPFKAFGISEEELPQIQRIGFLNPSAQTLTFFLDDLLIRN